MQLDLQGWSSIILALVGVAGAVLTYRLNRRGQATQAVQQNAANELARRAQGFDEMEALVERLTLEVARVEAKADKESVAQARRCRLALEHLGLALTVLQSQVTSEAALRSAAEAQHSVEAHQAADHTDEDPTAPPIFRPAT